ncbi:galanin and GMAP prepropeptide [Phyllostomus discolor]|uniref:Galanin peptides n=1 Tax=Phyllostomus discolor TaxID=89673 RepID=A0A7E6DX69_9CHIR|nr:galanin peptides [Phyllostomus discolor]KAF6103446.1 galanin and GMAP prepropeptide [Phyllostomus discolor]
MARGGAPLLASLLLAAALSASLGLGSPVKEKRGWTLNSAGYLLGPHAIDNHRSFHDKLGLTGKRELQPEVAARSGLGSPDRRLPEGEAMRALMEFLTFLHLKEAEDAVPALPAAESSEDTEQAVPRSPGKLIKSSEVGL